MPRHVADATVSNTSATSVSSYAGHSSTWTCRVRSEAVPRTPVVFRFGRTLRATSRGRRHGLKHICHKRVELRGTLQHVDLQSTIRGGTPHPRGISVRQSTSSHATWHIGSKSHPVPHHVADTTIPNASATGLLDQDPLGRPDHHLTRARAYSHSHRETRSVSEKV